ncbi:hypothetical protein RRG08_015101 [Elysia crispata]|uniref:Uncharacterized protein n=1 Tax=Elysia crispata TaxID=231223 RepID=A0AAE1B776_9GAST|nr:hypothetical protein RRG08_015101 [Elysia crispata]
MLTTGSGGGLLLKLQRNGVNGRIYNWLKGFLSNRDIRTKVNGVYSRTRPLKENFCASSTTSVRSSPPSTDYSLRTTS